ncbi:hypothetical protein L6Q96_07605 [Candidatus Binatia bacterium]|nr:hypothetical protein [Candidatus Binatia bacterium]
MQFNRAVTTTAMLAVLLWSCGSTTDNDQQVMRFVGFDGNNIDQQDSVNPGSAAVDVDPSLCTVDFIFSEITFELFTETIFNATFINEQKQDIVLRKYRLSFDPILGLGDVEYDIAANLLGGFCSNVEGRRCAVDNDCIVPGQTSATFACLKTPTTVGGLLLIDFLTKERIKGNVRALGRATNVKIAFTGNDPVRTYTVETAYTITFDEFCNCPSGQFCVPSDMLPQ